MLAACKLSLSDVAIVNKNSYRKLATKIFLQNLKARSSFVGVEPLLSGCRSFSLFPGAIGSRLYILYTLRLTKP